MYGDILPLEIDKQWSQKAIRAEFTFHEMIEKFGAASIMKTPEEMIKEKALWICVPLKPLNDVYLKTMVLIIFHREGSTSAELSELASRRKCKMLCICFSL